MAVKVTGIITPSSGSYVAQAENVAFTEGGTAVSLQLKLATLAKEVADLASTAVTGTADNIIYEGSTTIKQKITSLENNLGTTADKISYSYNNGEEIVTTNVKTVLDEVLNSTEGEQIRGIISSFDPDTALKFYQNPGYLKSLQLQIQHGFYKDVADEIEHRKLVGDKSIEGKNWYDT